MKSIKIKELFWFGVAGFFGYLVDAGITLLLSSFLGVYLARIPAFIAAATFTWLFNRMITFSGYSKKNSSIVKEYFHYVSLMVFGLLINYLVYVVSVSLLPKSNYEILLSVAFGSLAGMIVNYLNSKRFVFSKNSNN